ncbi:LytTR family DNA-binding domain-containing protein [Ekhidna sp.]|uniref:LytTR family DNA-binding domain-containing protein n=1 Tax=Ekhidna sp. TaxID=2608089 RepID=UPI003CCC0418
MAQIINTVKAHRKTIAVSIFIGLLIATIAFVSNWLMLIHRGEAPTPLQLIDISFYFFVPIVTWTVLTILIIHIAPKWSKLQKNLKTFLPILVGAVLLSPLIRIIDILIDFSIKNLLGMIEANPFSVLADVWLVVISSSPSAFLKLLIIGAIVCYFMYGRSLKKSLTIRAGDGTYHVLRKNSILYLTSSGNYLNIHTSDGTHRTRMTLKSLISELGEPFIRIHKSTIVNIEHISQLSHWRNGEYLVVMSDGKPLSSSKTYKECIDQIKLNLNDNKSVIIDPTSEIVHPTMA